MFENNSPLVTNLNNLPSSIVIAARHERAAEIVGLHLKPFTHVRCQYKCSVSDNPAGLDTTGLMFRVRLDWSYADWRHSREIRLFLTEEYEQSVSLIIQAQIDEARLSLAAHVFRTSDT